MNDVFISYSRRNKEFVQKLYEALTAANRSVWADWDSIPAASDWFAEIKQGIEETDAGIFVLSPEWVKSKECRKEMDYAVEMGKRLFPILYLPVDPKDVPPELSKINWVYMQDTDDFDKGFQTLCKAMDTDLDWIKTHTRIQVRALEWEKKNRSASFALRGEDLTEGEQFIASGAEKNPIPTHLQSEYVLASRKDATKRQRITLTGVTAALVISIALGIYAFFQAKISRAGELASLGLTEQNNNFIQAQLLGLEGYHTYGNSRTKSTLFTLLNSRPELEMFLQGHTAQVNSVTFSSNNKLLASGSDDNSIILWDFSNPENPIQLATLSGHKAGITSLAFSPDGKRLASGSEDRSIIVWDISDPNTPSRLATLSGHTNVVTSVAFSPDGKQLASGSWDSSIILWDVSKPNTSTQLSIFYEEYGGVISSVAFDPDGNRLVSGSWGPWNYNSIILWDISTSNSPSLLTTFYGAKSGVTSVAFSPVRNQLASGTWDNSIILWDIGNPEVPLATRSVHSAAVTSVAFSSDGKRLASGSEDKSIIVWDVSNPRTPSQITTLTGHSHVVSSVTFNQSGNRLVTGGWDASIILWNIDASNFKTPSQLVTMSEENTEVSKIAFTTNGKRIASGGRDTQRDTAVILLWDMSNLDASSQPTRLLREGNSVYSLAFSPDGNLLVSGGWNTSTILWDITNIENPIPLATLTGTENIVDSLLFSPDGKLIAAGSENLHTVNLWDVSDPKNPSDLAILSGHSSAVLSVAFSPDGKRLASGSKDGSIKLWDVSDPTSAPLLATLQENLSGVISVAFSPDGKIIASGSNDQSIRLWDVSNPKTPFQISKFIGHTAEVNSVAFNPNGDILASASEDRSIILWNIIEPKAPTQIATLSGYSEGVKSIGISLDGKALVSGSKDGLIILWDSDIQSWVKKTCQRIGRNFTQAEWAQYFVGNNYQKTCENWPEPIDRIITPPIATRASTGFFINNVNMNDAGNSITVSPGTPIKITYNYEVFSDGCPGCITQLVTGLGTPDITGNTCAYFGGPGFFPGETGTENVTIVTPSDPGTYPVVVEYNWQNRCEDALKIYGTGNSAMSPQIIGQVIVSASP